jgi:clan AA aspartic protease
MAATTYPERERPMGTVYADITLTNMFLNKSVKVRAMVDTGATHVFVPAAIAAELGFDATEVSEAPIILADGRRISCPRIAPVKVGFGDRWCMGDVGVLGDECLLGVVPLELMGLIVDPLQQCVTPNPKHPEGPVVSCRGGYPPIRII